MTLAARGWQVFAPEPATLAWVASVLPEARARLACAPRRHGGTWAPGVDLLPNDATGALPGGPPLSGAALTTAQALFGPLPLHPAQLSATHPGYPRRDPSETEAAHRFRRLRHATHLDGLIPEGPDRRRHLREPHAWILGVALTKADPDAAPLTVLDGSHRLIGQAFRAARPTPDTDLTDLYAATRRRAFDSCPRRALPLPPGGAVLLHRMTLHGVAPWAEGARADPDGRIIAYVRPLLPDLDRWLSAA